MRTHFLRVRLWVGFVMLAGLTTAMYEPVANGQQQAKVRRNKTIRLLEQGKVACGVAASTYQQAEQLRSDPNVDFVIYDMEHSPYDITALRIFAQFLISPIQPLPRLPLLSRIPAFGREMNQWQIKQVLDAGAWGVIVPTVETAEQAINIVRAVRYPQPYGAKDFEPDGQRSGVGATSWGIATAREYEQVADSWPLDPDGEMLIFPQIENKLGAQNAREIARVPGVSGLGAVSYYGDVSRHYRGNTDEMEKHQQTILAANKEFNKIPFCWSCTGLTPTSGTVQDAIAKIKEGWRMLNVTGCAEARRKLGLG